MTDSLFDTSVGDYQLKKEWKQQQSFPQAARLWRAATASRAKALVERYQDRIDSGAYEVLAEEARAEVGNLSGETGGWGAVARDTPPTVLLVGQNPYMMPLRPHAGSSFSTLSTSDRYFLWVLHNCCRGRAGAKQLLAYKEWTEQQRIDTVWTATPVFLDDVSNGRILNYEAARYYSLVEDELRLDKTKKKRALVMNHLQDVLDAGYKMLAAALRAGEVGHPQSVVALGKSWVQEFKSRFFDPSRAEDATHVLVETFHPSALGQWLKHRQETYMGIARFVSTIGERSGVS